MGPLRAYVRQRGERGQPVNVRGAGKISRKVEKRKKGKGETAEGRGLGGKNGRREKIEGSINQRRRKEEREELWAFGFQGGKKGEGTFP